VSDDQGRAQPPADPLALSDASLTSWLAHLESLHPSGQCGIELGLERVLRVKDVLSQDLQCPVITVGGTNGKGSTCAYLEAMYSFAGYRVGCYTSPHLLEYNERVRIDRLPVDDSRSVRGLCPGRGGEAGCRWHSPDLLRVRYTCCHRGLLQSSGRSPHPRSRLGGRLDAVNAYDADCAVITGIALDHTNWLGPTRESIAFEKAGIFRAGRPAICADPDPPQSLLDQARAIGADVHLLGRDFGYFGDQLQWTFWARGGLRRSGLANPALRGAGQLRNASAALDAIELLREPLPVPMQAIRRGLIELDLPGRFQVIPGRPVIVLDVAHNPQAAAGLAARLGEMPFCARTMAVVGMLGDKDIAGSLAPLAGKVDLWLLADLKVPRGASSEVLEAVVKGAGLGGCVERFASPDEAFARSAELAGENDRIVVFGSFYTVAAVMRSMQNGR
jgi:dihydrofolate synthase/folylpolyglutamate synthase